MQKAIFIYFYKKIQIKHYFCTAKRLKSDAIKLGYLTGYSIFTPLF
jgi:hypothetical protein